MCTRRCDSRCRRWKSEMARLLCFLAASVLRVEALPGDGVCEYIGRVSPALLSSCTCLWHRAV